MTLEVISNALLATLLVAAVLNLAVTAVYFNVNWRDKDKAGALVAKVTRRLGCICAWCVLLQLLLAPWGLA